MGCDKRKKKRKEWREEDAITHREIPIYCLAEHLIQIGRFSNKK
jgi:hypothetical protein